MNELEIILRQELEYEISSREQLGRSVDLLNKHIQRIEEDNKKLREIIHGHNEKK